MVKYSAEIQLIIDWLFPTETAIYLSNFSKVLLTYDFLTKISLKLERS